MINIGLVGAGFMAETHVQRYAAIDGARVTAVASPQSAPKFVTTHDLDARTYSDASTMYTEADIDAVDVCTPTPTHRELVVSAAERGLDVVCEKPLAHRAEDLAAIESAVSDAGITCAVGHVVRFFPEYAAIKQEVDDGSIGTIGSVRARRHIPPPDWAQWYADKSQSGGVLVDLAIHDIDYLRWLLGDVQRVFARETSWEEGQHAQAVLRFDDAIGYVDASTGLPPGDALTTVLELAGTNGLIEYSNAETDSLTVRSTAESGSALGNIPPDPVKQDGFHRELAAIVDSFENDTPPPVPLEDAIAAVHVALAAKRSVDRDEPVRPSEVVA